LRGVFHAGRERRRCVADNCGCGGGRGEGNEGRVMRGGSVPALQWRRGETKAEASMRCNGFDRIILSFRNNLNGRSQRAEISWRRVLVDVCCLAATGRAEKTGGRAGGVDRSSYIRQQPPNEEADINVTSTEIVSIAIPSTARRTLEDEARLFWLLQFIHSKLHHVAQGTQDLYSRNMY
jgi:hypothetical protein